MNIFVLDKSPIKSAQMQHNKHVVKMILESAQMLCSAFDKNKFDVPYRRTHYNHPCTIWTRKSMSNFMWLIEHGFALAAEYTHRYNKTHKSLEVIKWCYLNAVKLNINKIKQKSNFALAMPNKYKIKINGKYDAVKSYRNYYISEKLNNKTEWKNRKIPKVFKEKMEEICL